MRSLLLLVALAAFSSTGSAGADSGTGQISIVSPPDRSVLETPLASLVVRLQSGSVDELQLFVNKRRVSLPKRDYSHYTVCFDGLGLMSGANEIKVVGMKGGKKVEELKSRVFYRSDLFADASSAPDGFTRYQYHGYQTEKVCMPCHQLDFTAASEGETPAASSPCYQCHKKMLSTYANVHGPAAVWACLSCHNKKGTPKLVAVKPDSKSCFGCHEDIWSPMKYGHGPTAAGSCATCHDPHASNYRYFLRTSAGDLCLGCHEEIATKPHVIVGFSNAGHPVRRTPDPYHPGREFTCVSCHNPHAGSSPVFLQNYDGVAPASDFCKKCHGM
ncbi:cytochrome c3 family protein [Geomonas limicola]|nr:cytochrome c3 family protein [Geomonas limicola]